jgi:hypothetical protein
LLGVNIYGIKSFDLLVEAVGAPPTGPLTSNIIDLGDTEHMCISSSRTCYNCVSILHGNTSWSDHLDTSTRSRFCVSVCVTGWSNWNCFGSNEGVEAGISIAAGALIVISTKEKLRV